MRSTQSGVTGGRMCHREEMIEYRSARYQAVEASILNETETYLNIDGYLYAVVSLKELPDATFPGMLQNFSTLGFPVVVSGQVVIPDQVKVLKSYKKRLQKMTAAQKDANGNFKSNPEAEVAQAQLIQVQRDIISSSLKTAKLSLSVVVRTSQPAITLHDLERSERELANRTQDRNSYSFSLRHGWTRETVRERAKPSMRRWQSRTYWKTMSGFGRSAASGATRVRRLASSQTKRTGAHRWCSMNRRQSPCIARSPGSLETRLRRRWHGGRR